MIRRSIPVFLGVLVLAGASLPAAVQTPDAVVEKHLAAMGGREALSKLTSRKATGTITLTLPDAEISGKYEQGVKAPNKTRIYMTLDLSAMGAPEPMIVEQKFDGVAGIAHNSMQGDTEITGMQLENMRNNVFPSSLLNYKAAGTKVEQLPNEQVAGKDAIVLLVTPKSGSPVRLYLDPATYLVFRTIAKVHSPQMGELEQVGEASDYRTVDGVKIAFQVVNTNPQQKITIRLEKVEHNVALDDALFAVKK